MTDKIERETLAFSPLWQLTFMAPVLIAYLCLRDKVDLYIIEHPFFSLLDLSLVILYFWRFLKAFYLLLTLHPAVILTNESIAITIDDYIIKWTDILDVYMKDSGPGRQGRADLRIYYITIKVEDIDTYYAQIKNPFTRWFRHVTRNWRSDTIDIDLRLVRGDEYENLHKVLRYYQNNRGF